MKGQTLKGTVVLEKLLSSRAKIKILEGGSRSSKTWSIFQNIILLCQEQKGLFFTISRLTLTWIKATILKDFEELSKLYQLPVTPAINHNRPDQTYYLYGNEIAFIGIDEEQKLFGRKQDYFWLNEIIETKKEHFDQIEMRTTIGGWMDYNPRSKNHWVYGMESRDDVEFIHSTMLDNPFLPLTIVKKILSYEPTEANLRAGTASEYMWDVYGRGKRRAFEGLVFPEWGVYDKVTVDWEIYGLDFGFTNDPTTLVWMGGTWDSLFWKELIFETNLTNQDIGNRFSQLGLRKGYDIIIADSADPRSIKELCNQGWIVKPCNKGPDSVMHGIQLLQTKKHFLHKDSLNLQNEFKSYIFETDKDGKSINKPVDANNHTIDAGRYATTHKLLKSKKALVI